MLKKASSFWIISKIQIPNCLNIWSQLKRHLGLQSISLLSPVHSNPLFTPSINDQAFAAWRDLGVVSVKDLYIEGIFASFDQLVGVFKLQRSHFFRYLQVRDFARNRFPGFPAIPPSTLIDTILNINPYLKGTISELYNTLLTHQSSSSDKLRTIWSEDLNIEIEPEVWQSALKWVHASSICARHGVLQCKVIHRVHWSKSKLARIYPGTDPNCDKCHLGPANLSHMFWTCPVLSRFWKSAFDSLSAITSAKVLQSPLVGLFGVLPATNPLPPYFTELVAFLTLYRGVSF